MFLIKHNWFYKLHPFKLFFYLKLFIEDLIHYLLFLNNEQDDWHLCSDNEAEIQILNKIQGVTVFGIKYVKKTKADMRDHNIIEDAVLLILSLKLT